MVPCRYWRPGQGADWGVSYVKVVRAIGVLGQEFRGAVAEKLVQHDPDVEGVVFSGEIGSCFGRIDEVWVLAIGAVLCCYLV